MSKDSWNPQQYEKFKDERSQPFYDLMDKVDLKTPLSRIVDLGCGTGELTSIMHKKFKAQKTFGFDSSMQMLEKAKAFQSDSLSFQQVSIEHFHQPAQYDLILSNAAIQWCDHHDKIFRSIFESLKPGGQLAVQMPMNHDYHTHVIANQIAKEKPFSDWLAAHGGERAPTMLAPEEYASLLFKLGFKQQDVSMKVYGHVLESREGVVEWVKGTLLTYFQSRLSPEQYDLFLQEFRKRLFQKLPDQKPFFYPFKRIFLWARKA